MLLCLIQIESKLTVSGPRHRVSGCLRFPELSLPLRLHRGVAQLASAPALGAGGPAFESRYPDGKEDCSRSPLFRRDNFRFTHWGPNPPDPLRRFAPETRSTVFPDPALGGMPQMRIIGRRQYSTCRRGIFLRQIGHFCGRVGTRKALREVFSANASFDCIIPYVSVALLALLDCIIPYVSVALLALLCALGGMKRVAWCFGAGVLDLWRRCDFWVGFTPFSSPAPADGYTCAKGRVWRTGNWRCAVNAPWRKSCRGASICVSLREPLSNSVL